MAEYGKRLITDLPDQFKGKARIEALMMAIGRQFDELKEFYDDLNLKRALETAEGVQLDRIGDIVCLTRAEACEMISLDNLEMDDDLYRSMLGYKIMLNTSTATYYDIVHGIRDYYQLYPIQYSEDYTEPARIRITFPEEELDAEDPVIKNILKIKPAGVTLIYRSQYAWEIAISGDEEFLFSSMTINMQFILMYGRYLNGEWLLDGKWLLDGGIDLFPMSMECSFSVKTEESVEASLAENRDVWYLDGEYKLDGEKKLDAAMTEEDL